MEEEIWTLSQQMRDILKPKKIKAMQTVNEQKNLSKLPTICYGVLQQSNLLIQIMKGESGYYNVSDQPNREQMQKRLEEYRRRKDGTGIGHIGSYRDEVAAMSDFANMLNEEIGVTIQQRMAMEWGSMFNWSHGLADCDRYDDEGKPIKNKTENKTQNKNNVLHHQ